jgi:tRNA pseudouridine38-40 synthase
VRIACGIEYDGRNYHGWQKQKNSTSVQEVVEEALTKVANQPIRVVCAGRTDTGVHATAQVIHFDTNVSRAIHAWVLGGNTNLPADISLSWAKQVNEDFHARFSAIERSYRYIVLNRNVRSALLNKRVSWWVKKLSIKKMQAAASHLIGKHDFSSFRAIKCQAKSPLRDIRELSISDAGDLVYIDVRADAFLHHMVRNIAGVLLTIGSGEQTEDWSRIVLEAKDRTQGGITAPPEGLYLTDIRYPEAHGIPSSGYRPVFGDMQTK